MAQCRNVTRLLTLAPELPIGPYRRALIAWHLLICPHCRRHRQHLQQIRNALDQEETDGPAMPPEVRERITDKLQF